MGTKHTPGPWRAVKGALGSNPNVFEICSEDLGDHTYEVVGHVSTRKFSDMTRIDNKVIEANARLIAAAPDLLAALKECQQTLAMLTDHDRIKESRVQIAWAQAIAAEAKARTAIAKGEGK